MMLTLSSRARPVGKRPCASIGRMRMRGVEFCTFWLYCQICTREAAMITKTVSETRESLSDLLAKVQHGREDVTIVKHGKPVAVMISVEAMAYYEALENAELAREAKEAYAEYLADPGQRVSHEDLWAEIEAGYAKA